MLRFQVYHAWKAKNRKKNTSMDNMSNLSFGSGSMRAPRDRFDETPFRPKNYIPKYWIKKTSQNCRQMSTYLTQVDTNIVLLALKSYQNRELQTCY
jgi:hypothetical protein